MKVASVADMKAHLSEYIRETERGPVVVTRNGKPVAVLVAAGDDDDLERLLLGHSRHLQTILDAARQRLQAGAGIPHDQFWEELEQESEPGEPRGRAKAAPKKKAGPADAKPTKRRTRSA